MNYFEVSYKVLEKIYVEKSYVGGALSAFLASAEENKATVTKQVYGVLERDGELEQIVTRLTDGRLKDNIKIVLKLGVYSLLYLDGIPDYTVVNQCVELAAGIKGGYAKGLVNAVLRRVIKERASFTKTDKMVMPAWLKDKLVAQYGAEVAEEITRLKAETDQHVRVNTRCYSVERLKAFCKEQGIAFRESAVGGVFAPKCSALDGLFAKGEITYQSPSSVMVCRALAVSSGAKVLDMCAAPGGKSVLISEMQRGCTVEACDIHIHRAKLIEKYAKRMKAANVTARVMNGLEYNAQLSNKYDFVLTDVPCSGSGVILSKPDILLNLSEESLADLTKKQLKLLCNAAKYVKRGGIIVYSTCSVLDEENGQIVEKFLRLNSGFKKEKMPLSNENDGTLQLLPTADTDGFFMARLRRTV